MSFASLWFHYLDDFLAICVVRHKEAGFSKDFAGVVDLCTELGVPLAAGKSVDPCTKLIFLGLEIDTMEMTVSIPPGKRDRYASSLEEISVKRSERKRKLESVLGKLFHAASVIPVGRAFLRPLINKVAAQPYGSSWVSLGREDRESIKWWVYLLRHWNGVCLMDFPVFSRQADLELASDSAGSGGLGIVYGREWVAAGWPHPHPANIAVLELIPLVIAATIWGTSWEGRSVEFLSDNAAVVCSGNSLLPKHPHLASLIRELATLAVIHRFRFRVVHIPGVLNILPDMLSRGRIREFRVAFPQALGEPTPIPGGLLERLVREPRGDPMKGVS